MLKKYFIKFVGIVFAVVFVLVCVNINFVAIFDWNNIVNITIKEINELN